MEIHSVLPEERARDQKARRCHGVTVIQSKSACLGLYNFPHRMRNLILPVHREIHHIQNRQVHLVGIEAPELLGHEHQGNEQGPHPCDRKRARQCRTLANCLQRTRSGRRRDRRAPSTPLLPMHRERPNPTLNPNLSLLNVFCMDMLERHRNGKSSPNSKELYRQG